ncbi:MAG: (2Fe-2S)-binding protein [Desulfobacterales bacterium]|nr:(2Fe-2S)-binding protein [Desulfobacterales bacterium]
MKQVIELKINGGGYEVAAEPRDTLLEMLRQLGFKGTKEACGMGECGACTILMDGVPVLACLTLAVGAQGKEITTIEGLSAGHQLHPVQKAFVEQGAIQCGFCTPGMILAAKALLDDTPDPGEEDINRALGGHLCRCTGYVKIRKAIQTAGRMMRSDS